MTTHPYLPHTDADISSMLSSCGHSSLEELFADIPSELRLKAPYKLANAMTEPEVDAFFAEAAAQNIELKCFAGGGFYNHWTPSCIPALLSRSEFLTAYTPYQPEISQGTLQYIFEYQSMLCRLTDMDVCNASMYDGASATAEAVLMAVSASKRRKRVLISATLAPAVAQVVATYASTQGIILETIPEHSGCTDRATFDEMMQAGDVAAVVLASPNYFGILENYEGWAEICHRNKAYLIINSHASALGTIRSQGEWGADIACGEAQSLGIPLNYGGPGLGYLCCRRDMMRKMPGRIVGATKDENGKRSFVLTLQAREQHIRRQKATSNICSNQGIMTLHAAIYLSLLGAKGLKQINETCYNAAHALADGLCDTGKVKMKYPGQTFLNEFTVTVLPPLDSKAIIEAAAAKGILAGIAIDEDTLLITATEMNTPADVASYVQFLNNL